MNIPFKSALQHIKDIKERNKEFAKLSSLEKRREIAYEAVMLIIDGIVLPAGHMEHYWDWSLMNIKDECVEPEEFQGKLLAVDTCSVCQRGLMMLAQIRIGNNIHPGQNGIQKGVGSCIEGFDVSDFLKMEADYEEMYYSQLYINNTSEMQANICCNIIANGNFDTIDQTDYLKLWEIKLHEDKLS